VTDEIERQSAGLRTALAALVFVDPSELAPGGLHPGLEFLTWTSGTPGEVLRQMINEGDVDDKTAKLFLDLMISVWSAGYSSSPGLVVRGGNIVPAELREGVASYCVDHFSTLLSQLIEDLPERVDAATKRRARTRSLSLLAGEAPPTTDWRMTKAGSAKCLLILGRVARLRRHAGVWFEIELTGLGELLGVAQQSLPERSVASPPDE